jgi:hypothetical protein
VKKYGEVFDRLSCAYKSLILSSCYREEIVADVKNCNIPPLLKRKLQFYFQSWFRSFLAYVDEVFVLLNGVILPYRPYHVLEHKPFEQNRDYCSIIGSESRYHKIFQFFSACSCDGINLLLMRSKKDNEVSFIKWIKKLYLIHIFIISFV